MNFKAKTLYFFFSLLSIAFYLAWWSAPALRNADYKVYDFLASFETNPPSAGSTVVVEIDEQSLERLGQWPWPRVVTASLVKKISASHPAATILDLIFPEEDRTSPEVLQQFYKQFFGLETDFLGLPERLKSNDDIFAEAMNHHNVILPVFFNTLPSSRKECAIAQKSSVFENSSLRGLYESPYLLCSLSTLQEKATVVGHIQASADEDGLLRRVPLLIRYKEKLIPTLGLAALTSIDPEIKLKQSRLATQDIEIELLGDTYTTDEQTNGLLRLYPQEWFRTISAIDVLNGNYDPAFFQGKFVLIGATAMGLHDSYTFSDNSIRSGVFVHANLLENMLARQMLTQPSLYKVVNILLSFFLALIFVVFMIRKEYMYVIVSFFVSTLIAFALSYFWMHQNIYISIGYFLVPLLTYVSILAIVLFFIHYHDKKTFYEEMSKANAAMLESMALVAETRDIDTGAHIKRTQEYIRLLAEYINSKNTHTNILTPEYITNLHYASPLHDIGKVGIPDDILKKCGKLTDAEYTIMKTHSFLGKEIIANAINAYHDTKMLTIALNIAHYHHEKWDGSGYPAGLKAEEIPLEARLMAIADVYDALISRRCYKLAFTFENAENIIIEGRGTHFDPLLVDAFIVLKEEFKSIAQKITERES